MATPLDEIGRKFEEMVEKFELRVISGYFNFTFFFFFQVLHKQIVHDLNQATRDPEKVKRLVEIFTDPYLATENSHAVVVCTEWDEFVVSLL